MPQIDQKVAKTLLAADPGNAVLNALEMLLEQDEHLLKVDANERSITHRLAMYLQKELPSLNVDCEYNRDGHEPKRIGYFGGYAPEAEDTDARTVYPDIIAHVRGSNQNYLIIEVKKAGATGHRDDYSKLLAYRQELSYRFALFIELQTGRSAGVAAVRWISVDQAS